MAAAAALMLLAGLVWRLSAKPDPSDGLEALADRELRSMANGTGNVDFRSGDPREIREWVKARLGLDVRLDPVESGNAVRLTGAGILPFGRYSVAVIAYRVGDDYAAMLVAGHMQGRKAGAGHARLRMRPDGDTLAYSWSSGSSDYAIAFSGIGDPGRPCLLCHASAPAMMVFR
jgi:hypothetical protein